MFTMLTAATYKDVIASAEQAVFLISRKLCPHCKTMKKVLEKFAEKRKESGQGIQFFLAEVEDEPKIAADFKVEYVPAIIIIKQGKALAGKIGELSLAEMNEFFDNPAEE